MGRKGGCSNERAPEASGLLDTQYLEGFGEGCRGRSFTILLSIQNFFFFLRGEGIETFSFFLEIG